MDGHSEVEGSELGAEYWPRNLRQPVLFTAGIASLIEQGLTLFVEMNPHPILQSCIEQTLRARGQRATVVAALRRDGDEHASMLSALGQLYCQGAIRPPGARVPETARGAGAEASPADGEPSAPRLFITSARSDAALTELAASFADHLADINGGPERTPMLHDLCHGAALRRAHHERRLALVAGSVDSLKCSLSSFVAGEPDPGVITGRAVTAGICGRRGGPPDRYPRALPDRAFQPLSRRGDRHRRANLRLYTGLPCIHRSRGQRCLRRFRGLVVERANESHDVCGAQRCRGQDRVCDGQSGRSTSGEIRPFMARGSCGVAGKATGGPQAREVLSR